MVTNFEEETQELNEDELTLLPMLVDGFKTHSYTNPIKAITIVDAMNNRIAYLNSNNSRKLPRFTEARLRKCCNYIRSHGLLPLIATSNGYFVSHDKSVIESQIKSLTERANSIKRCAVGLQKFI